MKSDKGGGIGIMNAIDSSGRKFHVLNNANHYIKISKNEINIAYSKTDFFLDLFSQRVTDGNFKKFLYVQYRIVTGLCGIPKIHKNIGKNPFGPIIATSESKTHPLPLCIDRNLLG